MNEDTKKIVEKIQQVAHEHDAHSVEFGTFEYVRNLREWIDTEHRLFCYVPSGPLYRIDYGVGLLRLNYYKPETRRNDCVFSITSIDDSGASAFGKCKEEKVLELLNKWRGGFSDQAIMNKECSDIGLYLDWW